MVTHTFRDVTSGSVNPEAVADHSDDPIRVAIDVRVWKEICDRFPVEHGNYQTERMNRNCRMILANFIRAALRNEKKEFRFNQELFSRMTSSKTREVIVRFLNSSRFFRTVTKHSKGNHSIIRRLTGAQFSEVDGRQHKVMDCEWNDATCIWCGDYPVVAPLDCEFQKQSGFWKYAGSIETVDIDQHWYREYGRKYDDACRLLHLDQWHFLPCLQQSVDACQIDSPGNEYCLNLAVDRIEKGQRVREWYERRNRWYSYQGVPDPDEMPDPAELVQQWMSSWDGFKSDPLEYARRIDGRLYYPLVNQPREFRRNFLQIMFNGKLERCVEVDMSSTYYVLLASWLDPSDCKDRLIRDVADGTFYENLNNEAGGEFSSEDRDLLKIATQIDCLFGRGFRWSRLFQALSRRYPDLAAFIRHKRKNHDVQWLSRKLTNAEGSLFIEYLIPKVFKSGVPCLPIHDGLIVPASEGENVRSLCQKLSAERLGFAPKFGLKN